MRHANTQLTVRAAQIAEAISGSAYPASVFADAAGLPMRRDRKPASCTGGDAKT